MTQILKNSWVKNDGEGPLPRIDNLQLSSKAAIPLIQYHHRIIWFTHRENSSFNIIQNFCKGNTKHAGILLSHCPWRLSSYGVKKIYWYKVEAIYLIKEIKIKLVKKCFSKETFSLFTSLNPLINVPNLILEKSH